MDAKEMKERFMLLSLVPLDEIEFNEDEESLSVLYENTWLRILLIKLKESPEQFSIDVEFSMPTLEEKSSTDAYQILTLSLHYLEYIQSLNKMGFSLEVIGQDWLWIASRSFTETPNAEIFERLIPPLL